MQLLGWHRQGLPLECNSADISLRSTDQNSKAVSDILGHLFTHPSPSLSPPGNRMAAQVGHSAVMTCPNKPDATMVTWKISPKIGGPCTLGYRADQKKVDRTNCSDRVNCEFRSNQSYALEIQQVGMADEGNYSCEVVTQEGNFHQMYQLTVLVPPRLSLYCDDHRNPVCKAAAGRPAAEISWVPENNSMTETDSHDNGTVTVLSRFTAHSTDEKTVTCMVYHTTLNETKSIACSSYSVAWFLHCVIILGCLLSLLFLFALFHLYVFCDNRTMRNQ
ncbi:cell surface glycoprotein CD200 receptor 1-B-like isoform X1 [Anser cygnoides]|uniref:cell surface glycoprotein CD200 receptor 1-B-like isoform X1 n=2 Tax=Anser cygnoides TaxID=8845 RepID=UPI0034D15850